MKSKSRDAWEQYRLLTAERFLQLAMWVAPKDHPNSLRMTLALHAYFKKMAEGGVR